MDMQTLTQMALAFELAEQGLSHTKIAAYCELEEQVGALPINGDIADLINDQELGLGQ